MKVAIMQPYLFPYIGYFQLINAVDCFVLLDDVNYIKKGWINRNRILMNGRPHLFTLPLDKASQNKKICNLRLKEPYGSWVDRFLVTFQHAYAGTFARDEIGTFLEQMCTWPDTDLVDVLEKTMQLVCEKMCIRTPFYRSSRCDGDTVLRGQDRIIALCRQLGATDYFNLSGGRHLYNAKDFEHEGVGLHFLAAEPQPYRQISKEFVPFLSIIDLLANSTKRTRESALGEYSLTGGAEIV